MASPAREGPASAGPYPPDAVEPLLLVWPLRPVDSRQERWAKVGGEKTSLLHQVKFDDILFGIEPVSEMWSPRPNSFSRNVFVIDIDTGIRAEEQLKLREGMQNIE
eukprot:COSAG02_NODE_5397_length_4363_cov_31.840994_4_plen_106_part_00